jgi:hypothetical protein
MRSPGAVAAAVVAVAIASLLTAGCAGPGQGLAVTVRDSGGVLLAHVPLAADGFAVSYRNSVYGTVAEERYRVQDDGRFGLVELAADQLAVLEEYYAVPGPVSATPEGDRRAWRAEPPARPLFADLAIAATTLGERTVLVPGQPPVPLAPLVDPSAGPDVTGTDVAGTDVTGTDVTVVLDVEES